MTFTEAERRIGERIQLIIEYGEFTPNFSHVSKKTGIATSTLWDTWEKAKKHFDIEVILREKET